MRTCDICRYGIEKWQSYQVGASGSVHMACAMGRTPAPFPTAHLSHVSPTVFNRDGRMGRRETITSDEGIVFDTSDDAHG